MQDPELASATARIATNARERERERKDGPPEPIPPKICLYSPSAFLGSLEAHASASARRTGIDAEGWAIVDTSLDVGYSRSLARPRCSSTGQTNVEGGIC